MVLRISTLSLSEKAPSCTQFFDERVLCQALCMGGDAEMAQTQSWPRETPLLAETGTATGTWANKRQVAPERGIFRALGDAGRVSAWKDRGLDRRGVTSKGQRDRQGLSRGAGAMGGLGEGAAGRWARLSMKASRSVRTAWGHALGAVDTRAPSCRAWLQAARWSSVPG